MRAGIVPRGGSRPVGSVRETNWIYYSFDWSTGGAGRRVGHLVSGSLPGVPRGGRTGRLAGTPRREHHVIGKNRRQPSVADLGADSVDRLLVSLRMLEDGSHLRAGLSRAPARAHRASSATRGAPRPSPAESIRARNCGARAASITQILEEQDFFTVVRAVSCYQVGDRPHEGDV